MTKVGRRQQTGASAQGRQDYESPDPDEDFDSSRSGRYRAPGDLGWLVQLIAEMKSDLGGLKQQISSLEKSIDANSSKVDSLVKWSWLIRGAVAILTVFALFLGWLFSERLEEVRRSIVTIPQQESDPPRPQIRP
jgi:hypothetical protein